MRADLHSFVDVTLSVDRCVTDGSIGGSGGKLREESEMVSWFSEVKDLRQDHTLAVISEDKWQHFTTS